MSCALTDAAYATGVQFSYSATNGSDTGSVVAAVSGDTATATLTNLSAGTSYTVYGVATATNGSTPQSPTATFTTQTTQTPQTDHTAWFELPAKISGEGRDILMRTFYASARNYTMHYNTSTYTADWVAYPLTEDQTNGGRSGTWKATPDIPISQQINVWDGSYNVNLGSTSSVGYDGSKEFYARGHQIPDGDRSGLASMQTQTYYATNSTPQIQNKFNGGIWQQLESGVRGLTTTTDTVYVVTGATLRTVGGNEAVTYITPKWDSKQCPVPNYYYKVLLKVKRDASNNITSAMCVGVWLPHKEYSGENYQNYTKSVAEIERLTGYNFFANLPPDIQAAAEQNTNWNTLSSF